MMRLLRLVAVITATLAVASECREQPVAAGPPPPSWSLALPAAAADGGVAQGNSGLELLFSAPVLIEAKPWHMLAADGFGAVEIDPAGRATVVYGPWHWTSYDSGATWAVEEATAPGGMLVDTGSWSGEPSSFRVTNGGGGQRLHNLGAIMDCPPNGCWTRNHTWSSCNNASQWVAQRDPAWSAGCPGVDAPAPLSQRWFTSSPSAGYWWFNRTDGKIWSGSDCRGVQFRGLPLELNSSWGMCDGFTQPTQVELADGSVLATFPLVFRGE